jgi:valyl-tRNA synthetase
MIGERFEVARNFCNKLWNAARFVLLNTAENETAENRITENKNTFLPEDKNNTVSIASPAMLEDRWILSRLATVTKNVTESFETYRYADAVRYLYEFSWDEFCSFYVEMVKSRLADEKQRKQTQTVLIYVLNTLLRLLHPVIPFVTEEIWQRFRSQFELQTLPESCLAGSCFTESAATASWPAADESAVNPVIEEQFKVFQELLRAIRDVRATQNVPPKTEIKFSVRCDAATAGLLQPMEQYFLSMAKARATTWGESVNAPLLSSVIPTTGMDIYVDLSDLIDVSAEVAKLEKAIARLDGFIRSKESKLGGDFVQKAPPPVVEKERQSLAELQEQRQSAIDAIAKLRISEQRSV